jgi:hypothetical protein
MNPRIRRRLLSALCLAAFFSLAAPLFGDETRDMLIQAFSLTRLAAQPEHRAEQVQLLTQALELTRQIPDHHLRGHRALAAEAMRAALLGIKNGAPDHDTETSIQQAISELRICAGFVGASLPGLPPPTHVPDPAFPDEIPTNKP